MDDWLTYPGLSYQPFGNSMALTWARQPAIILIHSTEGGSYPGYGGGATNPHFTASLRAATCRQHTPLTRASRALKAAPGIHTNTGGVIQIEVIGSCVVGRSPSVLDFNDSELAYLAGLIRLIASEIGCPLVSTVRWVSYPASYANSQGQRLTASQWNYYRGILGHQHAPVNVHGDPGSMDITRLLELANGGNPAPGSIPVPVVVEEDIVVTRAENQADMAAAMAPVLAAAQAANANAARAAQVAQEAVHLAGEAVAYASRGITGGVENTDQLLRRLYDMQQRANRTNSAQYGKVTAPSYVALGDSVPGKSYIELSGALTAIAATSTAEVDTALLGAEVARLVTAEIPHGGTFTMGS